MYAEGPEFKSGQATIFSPPVSFGVQHGTTLGAKCNRLSECLNSLLWLMVQESLQLKTGWLYTIYSSFTIKTGIDKNKDRSGKVQTASPVKKQ